MRRKRRWPSRPVWRSAWRFAEIDDGKRDVVAGVGADNGNDADRNRNTNRDNDLGRDRGDLTARGAQQAVEFCSVLRARRRTRAISPLLAKLGPARAIGGIRDVQRAGQCHQQDVENEGIARHASGDAAQPS